MSTPLSRSARKAQRLLGDSLDRLDSTVRGRVYSVGIYEGASPLALAPAGPAAGPVLSRDSITGLLATFVADPFMLSVERRWYMFFEAMVWRPGRKKGEIGLATSDDGRSWSYRRIVLSEPFHLSYPYVFEWDSEYYMIPESSEAGVVRLYRADPFPERWVLQTELLTGGPFLDSSVFRHDGRWWMLTQAGLGNDQLRLFQARALQGPWTEHPRSPLSRDRRIARPAGRVIRSADRLVRFAQDCRAEYGSSVRALEITALTSSDYAERELGDGPILAGSGRGWNGNGMHQVDAHPLENGRWIACVDGWTTHVRRPREILRWTADHLRWGAPDARTPLRDSPGREGAASEVQPANPPTRSPRP